jgi:hypothetical protein
MGISLSLLKKDGLEYSRDTNGISFFSSEWFSATIRKALIARCFSPLGKTCCLSIQNRWFRLRRTVFSSSDQWIASALMSSQYSIFPLGRPVVLKHLDSRLPLRADFVFFPFLRYTIRIREHTYDGTLAYTDSWAAFRLRLVEFERYPFAFCWMSRARYSQSVCLYFSWAIGQ